MICTSLIACEVHLAVFLCQRSYLTLESKVPLVFLFLLQASQFNPFLLLDEMETFLLTHPFNLVVNAVPYHLLCRSFHVRLFRARAFSDHAGDPSFAIHVPTDCSFTDFLVHAYHGQTNL